MNDRKVLIESMIREGKSYAQIGEALGVSKQRAHQLCKELGLKTRRVITGTELLKKLKNRKPEPLKRAARILSRTKDKDRAQFIEFLILKGYSYSEIGIELGVSKQRAFQICESLGLKTERSKLPESELVGWRPGGPQELQDVYYRARDDFPFGERRPDALSDARRIINELTHEQSHTREITAKIPKSLADEFKAMPGITAENLRAALKLYILAINGGRNPSRVYVGGIPALRVITQEFVIERREELSMIGARVSKELFRRLVISSGNIQS